MKNGKRIVNKRVLVDTHIWIWYLNGESTLSTRIKKLIDASAINHELHVSAITVWEIAMLASKKKITLNTSCQAWIDKSLSLPGVLLIPLSPEIAIESCYLPGEFHGDPADRMLVASARIENLCLISRDTKIIAYCKKQGIEAIEA